MRRRILPWFGLFLLLGSLAWLQLYPDTWKPVMLPTIALPPEKLSLVVLDPGHGGTDSGVMAAGMLEKDLTLDIAKRVERLIREAGLPVMLTRQDDEYVSLVDRAALANREPDCIFVSIHFNEGKQAISTGVETYYAAHTTAHLAAASSWLPFLQPTTSGLPDVESQSLAGFIQEALVFRTQATNRGAKSEQFFVIANVKRPAVLVEGGFLTNAEDAAKLGTPEYREQIAMGISEGITRYRDVVEERPSPTAPTGNSAE